MSDEDDVSLCLYCNGYMIDVAVSSNIVSTLFCHECCANVTSTVVNGKGGCTVSREQALDYYLCTEEELAKLNRGLWRQQYVGEESIRYLTAEIVYFARERVRPLKEDLEKRTNLRLEDIDPVVRVYLLGDYLNIHRPVGTTTLDDVLKRFAVLDQVLEIRREFERADVGAAFEYCMAHPGEGAQGFVAARYACDAVFRLLAYRIRPYLTPLDVISMSQTPLREIAHEYLARMFDSKDEEFNDKMTEIRNLGRPRRQISQSVFRHSHSQVAQINSRPYSSKRLR